MTDQQPTDDVRDKERCECEDPLHDMCAFCAARWAAENE